MSNANKLLRSLLNIVLSILLVTSQTLVPAGVLAEVTTGQEYYSKLEYKVAKGYSNKFCNAIGIGVSVDGALKMAISENKQASFNPSLWFEIALNGNEEINNVDKDRLISLVSSEVVSKCGYPLGLAGEGGVEEFKLMFLTATNDVQE